jgi:hypothetical protein
MSTNIGSLGVIIFVWKLSSLLLFYCNYLFLLRSIATIMSNIVIIIILITIFMIFMISTILLFSFLFLYHCLLILFVLILLIKSFIIFLSKFKSVIKYAITFHGLSAVLLSGRATLSTSSPMTEVAL